MSKSDDSKRADAQAAQKAAQISETVAPESIVEQLQATAVNRQAAGDKEGAESANAMLALLSRAMGLFESMNSSMSERMASIERARVKRRPVLMTCPLCRQYLYNASEKAGVCTGKHVAMVVGPQNMDMWRYFPGVIHNGIRYSGRCAVPAAIVDSIKVAVSRWERRERALYMPGGTVMNDVSLDKARASGLPIIEGA